MRNKGLIFSIFLVFIIVLGVSVVSAQDADDTVISDGDAMPGLPDDGSGTVSGGVDVVSTNPGGKSGENSHTGELTYEIPKTAKEIKSATVYVNVYTTNAKNESGLSANTSIITKNGEQQVGSEDLWTAGGSSDGKVYTVNDHAYKVYSDYQIKYDVTPLLKGLNGTSITIKVNTFPLSNGTDGLGNVTYYKYDGRIKLIALILAYDDGDSDEIKYWINAGQAWTKANTTTTINTGALTNLTEAKLHSVVLSSADANYTINGKEIAVENHTSGSFNYQYNRWDVTDALKGSQNLTLFSKYVGTSPYGSLKNVLAVLVATKKVNTTPSNGTTPNGTTPNGTTPAKTPVATKITAKKATFKAKKSKKYAIVLKAGKKAVSKVKVTLKVGKKTYKAKTNAKGKAVFKLKKLNKKGKYTAVIKFAGNANYKASTKKVKIVVKK